jgi:hypothetical protein
MKKVVLTIVSSMLVISSAIAQVDKPSVVPFGKSLIVYALAEVSEYEYEAYTFSGGLKNIVGEDSRSISQFDSIEELADQVEDEDFDCEIEDPRKTINIEARLLNDEGESLFTSYGGFTLDVERDINGKPEYSIPDHAGYVNFWFTGIRVHVPGVVSARATAPNKEWEFDVNSEGIYIPGYMARSSAYKTLELTFSDGQVVEYDRFGQKVEGDDYDLTTPGVSFSGISIVENYDNEFYHSYLDPKNGWTSNYQFTTSGGEVEFTVHEDDRRWSRPTHVWVVRIEDIDSEDGYTVYPYDSGNFFEYDFSRSYDLDPGTYYIHFEWRGDVNIYDDGGAKG